MKVSGQSENISDNLLTFQTILKVFTLSGKLLDNLETLKTIGNFPEKLESLQTTIKLSRNLEIWNSSQSGKFPDHLKIFQTIWKV